MRKFKVIKAQTIGVRRESQQTRATLDGTYKSNEGVRRSGNQISSAYSVSAYGDIIVRPKSRDEFSHPREMSQPSLHTTALGKNFTRKPDIVIQQ
jgi:hypothetical protein